MIYARNDPPQGSGFCVSDYDTVNVIAITPNFSYNQTGATVNFTDLTNGATTWDWNFGDGNTSNLQNPSHTVTLKINGQCVGSQTISVLSGLESDIAGSFVKLFPNPAKDRLIISLEEKYSEDLLISINDLQGKLIASHILKAGNESMEIEISDLESAVYTVKILGTEINENKMLIIE